MSIDVNVAIKLLTLATETAMRAQQARAEARRLAEQAGVSKADLDAADARFQHVYDFSEPATTPEAPTAPQPVENDPYAKLYREKPSDSLFAAGDRVYRSADAGERLFRVERASDPELGAGGWIIDHVIS